MIEDSFHILNSISVSSVFIVGKYYYRIKNNPKRIYKNAKNGCKKIDMGMFTPDGEYEWNHVMKMLFFTQTNFGAFWMGLQFNTNDKNITKFFDNSGPENVDAKFTLLDTAEKVDLSSGCVYLIYSHFGVRKMRTSGCQSTRAYICKAEGKKECKFKRMRISL